MLQVRSVMFMYMYKGKIYRKGSCLFNILIGNIMGRRVDLIDVPNQPSIGCARMRLQE